MSCVGVVEVCRVVCFFVGGGGEPLSVVFSVGKGGIPARVL